ncbi:MAG: alpha/beta hydrolase [Faecalibacterium sp.]
MKKLVLYIHGKGGSATEAEHYKPLFPNCDVVGLEYTSQFPWEALNEFPTLFDELCPGYDSVDLIANSIGAFFAMHALSGKQIEKAHFISPVVDMEKLIMDMMGWANVTEDELHNKQTIPTNFGETLSWEYLCYVRANPIQWEVPTRILYGEKDNLTSYRTISAFADQTHASLTVMKNGEHWFHNKEQMDFLDAWISESTR